MPLPNPLAGSQRMTMSIYRAYNYQHGDVPVYYVYVYTQTRSIDRPKDGPKTRRTCRRGKLEEWNSIINTNIS